MIIRPAVANDNEALCRMELMAPQGTALRLTEQRRDFFARARQFPGSILMVAADDAGGKLAGVLGGAPVDLRVAGRERRGGFLFDFRSNPEYKRGISRIIYQLWGAVEGRLLETGVEFIYGLVKEDNPAGAIYQRMGTKTRGHQDLLDAPRLPPAQGAATGSRSVPASTRRQIIRRPPDGIVITTSGRSWPIPRSCNRPPIGTCAPRSPARALP